MKRRRKLFHGEIWCQQETKHLPKATPSPLLFAFRE